MGLVGFTQRGRLHPVRSFCLGNACGRRAPENKLGAKPLISFQIPVENISFKQEKQSTSLAESAQAQAHGTTSHRKDLTLVPGALVSESRSH